jgi:hypothetical protein
MPRQQSTKTPTVSVGDSMAQQAVNAAMPDVTPSKISKIPKGWVQSAGTGVNTTTLEGLRDGLDPDGLKGLVEVATNAYLESDYKLEKDTLATRKGTFAAQALYNETTNSFTDQNLTLKEQNMSYIKTLSSATTTNFEEHGRAWNKGFNSAATILFTNAVQANDTLERQELMEYGASDIVARLTDNQLLADIPFPVTIKDKEGKSKEVNLTWSNATSALVSLGFRPKIASARVAKALSSRVGALVAALPENVSQYRYTIAAIQAQVKEGKYQIRELIPDNAQVAIKRGFKSRPLKKGDEGWEGTRAQFDSQSHDVKARQEAVLLARNMGKVNPFSNLAFLLGEVDSIQSSDGQYLSKLDTTEGDQLKSEMAKAWKTIKTESIASSSFIVTMVDGIVPDKALYIEKYGEEAGKRFYTMNTAAISTSLHHALTTDTPLTPNDVRRIDTSPPKDIKTIFQSLIQERDQDFFLVSQMGQGKDRTEALVNWFKERAGINRIIKKSGTALEIFSHSETDKPTVANLAIILNRAGASPDRILEIVDYTTQGRLAQNKVTIGSTKDIKAETVLNWLNASDKHRITGLPHNEKMALATMGMWLSKFQEYNQAEIVSMLTGGDLPENVTLNMFKPNETLTKKQTKIALRLPFHWDSPELTNAKKPDILGEVLMNVISSKTDADIGVKSLKRIGKHIDPEQIKDIQFMHDPDGTVRIQYFFDGLEGDEQYVNVQIDEKQFIANITPAEARLGKRHHAFTVESNKIQERNRILKAQNRSGSRAIDNVTEFLRYFGGPFQ